ncbi:MAG: diaminopimelate epimerase [Burkholderiales bacterium]|nr:diaminopimelate epimerase [Burkholderiales bacterium]MBL6879247.1 diaminopimelate epimerase [Burkholderiales bacterium]
MKLKFTKMHGTGNDFVVIDATQQAFTLSEKDISLLSNRRFGIGFDQLLVVGQSKIKDVDFSYRIFNADGGEVNQCGNGARCFVTFVHDKKLTNKDEIIVETRSGIIKPRLEANGSVSVNMGPPIFNPIKIPISVPKENNKYSLDVNDRRIEFGAVSMGNPHAVIIAKNIDDAPVETVGRLLENNELFPERVNVNFMEILSRESVNLRVWERGAGETLSCGTGACASVVFGIKVGLLDSPCKVFTRGGELTIFWEGGESDVDLSGSAKSVFEGEIDVGGGTQ